jgi:predicted MPP superfamily phosphohydrolase
MTDRLPTAVRRAAAIAGIAATGILTYAHLIEPRWLRVERWTVRVPNLPAAWERMRIVHLTDIQSGMWLQSRRLVRHAIERAVSLRPDLVVLTGDFVHAGHWIGDNDLYMPLGRSAPTVAVLGNHDHLGSDQDTRAIVNALRDQGVTVLMNQHVLVDWRGARWMIVGVDDLASGHTDLLAAITGIPRDTRLLALLTHVPDMVDYLPDSWFPLVFAGHTHGAQVRLSPLRRFSWMRLMDGAIHSKYPRGWFEVAGGLLYVNRGLGLSNVPVRFGAPPEVALFVLTGGRALSPSERWRRGEPAPDRSDGLRGGYDVPTLVPSE